MVMAVAPTVPPCADYRVVLPDGAMDPALGLDV
jgi:hypothetical protein